MNKFEKIIKELKVTPQVLSPEEFKEKKETLENQLLDLMDKSKFLTDLEKSGKAKVSDKDQLVSINSDIEEYTTFLDSIKNKSSAIDTTEEFNIETGEIEKGIEVQFESDIQLPVEIKKYCGSYFPRDKRTKVEGDILLHKHETLFHDNASRHPTMMFIHSLEKIEVGFYLGSMYLGYFNGKYETKIRYKPCTELEFQKAKNHLKENNLSSWKTGLDVEIYTITETRGKFHYYEAYLIDTIRGYPVRMTLSTMDKLSEGLYCLDVKMKRNEFNGTYKPENIYYPNHSKTEVSTNV